MEQTTTRLRMAVRKFRPFETAIQKLWTAFLTETGYDATLEAVAMDLAELHDSILAKRGLENGDWDIAHLSTDWIGEALHAGALQDLSPLLEHRRPQGFPEGWPDSLLQMQTRDSGIFGLPFHDGPECLIYRKDLMEDAANQSRFSELYSRVLVPPRSWEEFSEVARFFHQPKRGLQGAIMAAFPDGHNAVFDFCIQLWSRGGELTDERGYIRIDTPEAAEALGFYRQLLGEDGELSHACHGYDSVRAGQAFARGEAAMMVNWFGFAAFADTDETSRVKGLVDVAPLPEGRPGKGVSLNSYWIYTLGSGSRHRQLAYEFIRFAVSEAADRLLTLEGGIGCRLSSWRDPQINAQIPYYHKLEQLHQNARCLPALNQWSRIAEVIDLVMSATIHSRVPIDEILKMGQQKLRAHEHDYTH